MYKYTEGGRGMRLGGLCTKGTVRPDGKGEAGWAIGGGRGNWKVERETGVGKGSIFSWEEVKGSSES